MSLPSSRPFDSGKNQVEPKLSIKAFQGKNPSALATEVLGILRSVFRRSFLSEIESSQIATHPELLSLSWLPCETAAQALTF